MATSQRDATAHHTICSTVPLSASADLASVFPECQRTYAPRSSLWLPSPLGHRGGWRCLSARGLVRLASGSCHRSSWTAKAAIPRTLFCPAARDHRTPNAFTFGWRDVELRRTGKDDSLDYWSTRGNLRRSSAEANILNAPAAGELSSKREKVVHGVMACVNRHRRRRCLKPDQAIIALRRAGSVEIEIQVSGGAEGFDVRRSTSVDSQAVSHSVEGGGFNLPGTFLRDSEQACDGVEGPGAVISEIEGAADGHFVRFDVAVVPFQMAVGGDVEEQIEPATDVRTGPRSLFAVSPRLRSDLRRIVDAVSSVRDDDQSNPSARRLLRPSKSSADFRRCPLRDRKRPALAIAPLGTGGDRGRCAR